MYTLIVKDEYGNVRTLENVLDYDALTKEDVNFIVVNDNLTPLTDEQLQKVTRQIMKFDNLPSLSELKWVIKDVLEERA